MATTLDAEIKERIAAFAEELTALVKRAALEKVGEALGGVPLAAAAARGGTALGRRRAPAAPSRGAAGAPRRRKKGEKRSPEALETLTSQLMNEIKSKPGRRIEEIAESMGISTKELTLPAKKLIKSKKVSTKGEKRATRYFSK